MTVQKTTKRDDLTKHVIAMARHRDDAVGDATIVAIERLEAKNRRLREALRGIYRRAQKGIEDYPITSASGALAVVAQMADAELANA